jgi:hypothetical protein
MNKVRVTSRMAAMANADPGSRIRAGGTPYPTTIWEGEVDLAPFATTVSYSTGETRELPLPEAAFRFFNRVEEADVKRLEEIGYDLPSLSVGDFVEIDGRTWEVAPVGFEEMTAGREET